MVERCGLLACCTGMFFHGQPSTFLCTSQKTFYNPLQFKIWHLKQHFIFKNLKSKRTLDPLRSSWVPNACSTAMYIQKWENNCPVILGWCSDQYMLGKKQEKFVEKVKIRKCLRFSTKSSHVCSEKLGEVEAKSLLKVPKPPEIHTWKNPSRKSDLKNLPENHT